MSEVSLQQIVGKNYFEFWNYKGLYRVVKGSRSSKKSTTTALNFIFRLMKYPQSNLLVVRKTYRTLKDSCYYQLKWAIHKLGVDDYWNCKESPLEMTYIPTGQKIFFRGLDDPLKVTSIVAEVGYLNFLWIEEAYEITKESDFDTLDESIRGKLPDGLFKQCTLIFNPWNEHHWLKKRFFDNPNEDTLAITTNYKCNEFLDEADLKKFELMKANNPRRYRTAGLGEWGISEGLIFENWEERKFELDDIRECKTFCGLDFGYTNDETAFIIGFINKEQNFIYIWDELYKTGLTNPMIYEELSNMGYSKEHIIADCAEPKSIAELNQLGMRIEAARKGRDSIINGIQFIQNYKIIIHPRCVNFITEISNYSWKEDKSGKKLNEPIDDFNHAIDAMRYGLEKYMKGNTMEFSNFSVFGFY